MLDRRQAIESSARSSSPRTSVTGRSRSSEETAARSASAVTRTSPRPRMATAKNGQ